MKRIKKYLSLILMSICLLLPTNVLKAYNASINVSADRTYLVVGNTINVSVTLSSSDSLGVWDYNISYDTSKLKLISGDERIIDTGDPSKYSVTNTFEFKVIASGTSTISVKNLSVLEYYSKESMDVSESSVVITGITQEELEASYSKNNDLASLTVDGYSLSPEFNKDTLDYTVVVPSNTEKVTIGGSTDDYKSTANGFGEFDVSEGENKFTVTVTAENGSTKTYTVKVKVEDTNPIEVLVDGIKHTVVKRESSLKAPSNYEKTTVKINGIEVPGFKNTITNFTLVGLKNQEGELNLYIYDEKENTFTLYNEIKTSGLRILPTKPEKDLKNYTKVKISINSTEIDAYRYTGVEDFYVIYGIDLDTGLSGYFQYDSKYNTLSRYNDKIISSLLTTNTNYYNIIIILGIETILLLLVVLITLTRKNKRKRKKEIDFDIGESKEVSNKLEENKQNKNEK